VKPEAKKGLIALSIVIAVIFLAKDLLFVFSERMLPGHVTAEWKRETLPGGMSAEFPDTVERTLAMPPNMTMKHMPYVGGTISGSYDRGLVNLRITEQPNPQPEIPTDTLIGALLHNVGQMGEVEEQSINGDAAYIKILIKAPEQHDHYFVAQLKVGDIAQRAIAVYPVAYPDMAAIDRFWESVDFNHADAKESAARR